MATTDATQTPTSTLTPTSDATAGASYSPAELDAVNKRIKKMRGKMHRQAVANTLGIGYDAMVTVDQKGLARTRPETQRKVMQWHQANPDAAGTGSAGNSASAGNTQGTSAAKGMTKAAAKPATKTPTAVKTAAKPAAKVPARPAAKAPAKTPVTTAAKRPATPAKTNTPARPAAKTSGQGAQGGSNAGRTVSANEFVTLVLEGGQELRMKPGKHYIMQKGRLFESIS